PPPRHDTLSLHDALPISGRAWPRPTEAERVPRAATREAEGPPLLRRAREAVPAVLQEGEPAAGHDGPEPAHDARMPPGQRACSPDRKSTRLNSSHVSISY